MINTSAPVFTSTALNTRVQANTQVAVQSQSYGLNFTPVLDNTQYFINTSAQVYTRVNAPVQVSLTLGITPFSSTYAFNSINHNFIQYLNVYPQSYTFNGSAQVNGINNVQVVAPSFNTTWSKVYSLNDIMVSIPQISSWPQYQIFVEQYDMYVDY